MQYVVDGVGYSSLDRAYKAFKRLLHSLDGHVVDAASPVYPLLMRHPNAMAHMFTPAGVLKHIVVRVTSRHACPEVIIEGDVMSIKKCFKRVKPVADWSEYQRLHNACRTAVSHFIAEWKTSSGSKACAHCKCSLPSAKREWHADHVDPEFCTIVNAWLETHGGIPATELNDLNSQNGGYHYRFAHIEDADAFYAFHKPKAVLVSSCAPCNIKRGVKQSRFKAAA